MTVLMASFRVNAIPTSMPLLSTPRVQVSWVPPAPRTTACAEREHPASSILYSNITAALSVIGFDQVSVFPTHFSIVVAC
jgi:hypothetical protein